MSVKDRFDQFKKKIVAYSIRTEHAKYLEEIK